MINFISDWVRNIIYIIIFIVFLEILLPNNSMRKYVKVVAGLLVMVVILTPFTQLFGKQLNLQDVMSKYYIDINQIDVKSQNELLEGQQKELALKILKERISTRIKNQIENMVDKTSANVIIDVYENSEDERYGQIKNVQITLMNEKKENSLIEPIEKVEIGVRDQNQKKMEALPEDVISITQAKENEIKEFILDFYNVPIENISINKQRNNLREEEQ